MKVFKNQEKGVSLYLALAILSIVLAIALGVSGIFLGQVDMMRSMGYSVIAFYAADAGIEVLLENRSSPGSILETLLPNEATYEVIVTAGGVGDCTADYYCVKSIGRYKGTNRAIEIEY